MALADNEEPLVLFARWLQEAAACPGIKEPTAMSLATADATGKPSVRMVLLKEAGVQGFTFYTHMESRKSQELAANPQAALCFYWRILGRQIRIEGKAARLTPQEADSYFASRARESQLGAWASAQSQSLDSPALLRQRFIEMQQRFAGQPVPRPEYWSGWRVIPEAVEFWQQGEHRLHHRELYLRAGAGWEKTLLYP